MWEGSVRVGLRTSSIIEEQTGRKSSTKFKIKCKHLFTKSKIFDRIYQIFWPSNAYAIHRSSVTSLNFRTKKVRWAYSTILWFFIILAIQHNFMVSQKVQNRPEIARYCHGTLQIGSDCFRLAPALRLIESSVLWTFHHIKQPWSFSPFPSVSFFCNSLSHSRHLR